jgi:hypothetical protein
MGEVPPRVGDTVWYYAYGTPGGEHPAGVPRAAIVTNVHGSTRESMVDLAVLNPTGLFFNTRVAYGPGQGGKWGYRS